MNGMRYGSLFSGYAGLDCGVQSVLGGSTAWHCEIEPAPSRILAHHWPDVPNLGDITAVDWDAVEPVDVLTGGFPCQDVSHAGKRLGLKPGTRSGLWAHMAYAIDKLRPRLVVAENVRGLLSAEAGSDLEPCAWCVGDGEGSPLRALGAVLGDLADLGYDAQWVGVRAADAGAPHGRFRVFVFAWPAADAGSVGRVRGPDLSRGGWCAAVGRQASDHAGDAGASRAAQDTDVAAGGQRRVAAPGQAEGGRSWSDAGRRGGAPAADAGGVGQLRRPEQDVEPAGRVAAPRGDDADGLGVGTRGVRPELTPDAHPDPDGLRRRTARRYDGVRSPGLVEDGVAWGDYEPAIRRWERVLGRVSPAPTEPGKNGQPRLSPAFVEWMMGLPPGHVTDVGLTRNEQLKALGNGVVPQQAALATRMWLATAEAVAA